MNARLRSLGKELRSKVQEFFDAPVESDATPLELLHACLDRVEGLVQPAGRGRRVFPYHRLVVTIRQPQGDRAPLEAVFADLDARVRERLAELNCESPAVATSVTIVKDDETTGPVISVQGIRDAVPEKVMPLPATVDYPLVTIAVEKGTCGESEYAFREPLIAIGRTADPTDFNGQLRRNHVAFSETRDGINETVGRAHARLEYDRESGGYSLFNEGSSNPTAIVRDGRMFRVAPRDPRGVRVRSGDQVQLGRALLRITIGGGEEADGG